MQTKTTHTPGPWNGELYAYSQGALDNWRIFSSHAASVACTGSCEQIAIVNAEADARLIAAAPALLEALEAAADALDIAALTFEENGIAGVYTLRGIRDQGAAAVAQAKGEA